MHFQEFDLEDDDERLRPQVRLGCDLGMVRDPAAIAACKVTFENRGNTFMKWVKHRLFTVTGPKTIDREIEAIRMEPVYHFYNTKRLDLGTDFALVGDIIAQLACDQAVRGVSVKVLIDVTNNQAIMPTIRAAFARRRAGSHVSIIPIVFTGGDGYSELKGTVSKVYLANRLRLLARQRRLKFPAGMAEAGELQKQLQAYDETVTAHGNPQYGAASGFHDDLISAFGLCVTEHGLDDGEDDPDLYQQIANFRGL